MSKYSFLLPPKILEKLEEKSWESDIPIDVLVEVFQRGYSCIPPRHLSQNQYAWNRVNSFIAGGRARKLDEDLDRTNTYLREPGTDSLVDIYKRDTPGQHQKTIEIIKKVVKQNFQKE